MPGEPMLVRMLSDLLRHPALPGEVDPDRARRWLGSSEVGWRLKRYLSGEADLLLMAANRLNVSADDELREISRELARAAGRLRTLQRTDDAASERCGDVSEVF